MSDPSAKIVLVTGGAGYIGLHTVLALREAGYRPVVVDDLSRGRRQLLPSHVPLHVIDICDTQNLAELCGAIQPHAVMHLAARLSVEESTKLPLDYYKTNVDGTISVCRAMAMARVPHLVFSSTCSVYGEAGGEVNEDTPVNAYSPYGASKVMAEQIIRDGAKAHGFTYATLRYFNVTGADSQLRAGPYTQDPFQLVDRIAQAVYGDVQGLTVNGTDYPTEDGTAVRDYIHVSDIAQAHLAALRYLEKGGSNEIFNCGYGQGLSVQHMVDSARKISQVDFPVTYGARRAGDIAEIQANADKIKTKTGWQPQHDQVDTMIGSVLDWYAAQTGRSKTA
ncbi:MAG TPA: UDP-glucose 4-epimerase GalE [Alphaproteobacteria bacterium]